VTGELILVNLTKCLAVDVCPPHVPLPVTEWVAIVVYESSNIMKMVGDDLKTPNFLSLPDAKECFGLICVLSNKDHFFCPKVRCVRP
jgi:hypothetical protein